MEIQKRRRYDPVLTVMCSAPGCPRAVLPLYYLGPVTKVGRSRGEFFWVHNLSPAKIHTFEFQDVRCDHITHPLSE